MNKQHIEVFTALVLSTLIYFFFGEISNFTFITGWLFSVVFTILYKDKN